MREVRLVYGLQELFKESGYIFYTDAGDISTGSRVRVYMKDGILGFNIKPNHDYIDVPNLTVLSEEEFFQQSVAWDHSICIELVRAVQQFGLTLLENPEKNMTAYRTHHLRY